MEATLVSYTLRNSNWKNRNAIQRLIYGYTDHSNNNAYSYKRKGLLHKDIGFRLNRGVLILFKNKNKILKVLKDNKATIKTIQIEVSPTNFM